MKVPFHKQSSQSPEPSTDGQPDQRAVRSQSVARHFVVMCLYIGLLSMIATFYLSNQQATVQVTKPSQATKPSFSNIDINTADWTSFSQLEGIGPTLGFRIVADRKHFGPFLTIDDLLRVEGIGPLTLDRIRSRLTISHDQLKPTQ